MRKLRSIQPQRVWRLECQPGEELQLDFGLGAPIKDGQDKARRTWVLRMVLSYSRKAYSEAVTRSGWIQRPGSFLVPLLGQPSGGTG